MWVKTVTPRFGDVDGLRHINNCMLPVWFELAREPLFRLFHPELDFSDWRLIMARISVDFVAQMRLGHDVLLRTRIKKLGRSSMTVAQEAWQQGELGAKGEAVVVYYDFKEGKSLAIPEEVRQALAPHIMTDDETQPRSRSGRFRPIGSQETSQ